MTATLKTLDYAVLQQCMHCGMCLPTCPTYVLFGEEMDSPRGRIYLMNKGLDEEPMNDEMVRHWDLCLGCMACVTACPSGVQYDKLIESTRQQVERRVARIVGTRRPGGGRAGEGHNGSAGAAGSFCSSRRMAATSASLRAIAALSWATRSTYFW